MADALRPVSGRMAILSLIARAPGLPTAGVLVLVLLVAAGASAQEDPSTWVLRGASVIDVERGQTLPDADVVVAGDRIACVAVAGHCRVPDGAEVLERSGYVIPGLWNSHAHITAPITYLFLPTRLDPEAAHGLRRAMLRIYLASGVTGLVTLIDDPMALAPLEAAAATGDLLAPRIFTCGVGISYPGSWNYEGAATPTTQEAARASVEEQAAAGVDCIKITVETGPGPLRKNPRMPKEIVEAIVAEAHDFGLPVYAHATDPEEMLDVVEAGADVLAHSLDDAEGVPDELIDAVSSQAPFFTPTLVLSESFFRFIDRPDELKETFLRSRLTRRMRSALRDSVAREEFIAWLSDWVGRDALPWARENFARSLSTTRTLLESGAIPLVGTDPVWYVVPGYDVHREMELMVRAGLAPLEALRAATINAAKALRREADYGSVEAGKRADFVLLEANPLEDITRTRTIDLVVLGGRLFDAEGLLAVTGSGG